jgi:hypothetical protein
MSHEEIQSIKKELEKNHNQFLEYQIQRQKQSDEMLSKLEAYITADNKWKNEEVKPFIDQARKINGFADVGVVILKFLVLLGAAWGVIWTLIKFLKDK